MTNEESMAEAERLLREAGWAPHPKLGYVSGPLVMGADPSGGFHIKNIALVMEGHPAYGPDTPDEHHEAAAWLIARFAVDSGGDAEHGSGDEAHGEIGADAGGEPAGGLVSGAVASRPGEDDAGAGSGVSGAQGVVPGGVADDALDAEWAEIDPPPAASSEPAEAPQNRFYGLDDLDRRRALRIGDVAVIAAERIAAVEEEAGETDGEWLRVQGHVVSHLDKFTGAYTHPDRDTYDRFLALSAARARIASIDEHRKQVTTALLSATREEVEAFDPQDGWP